MAYTRPFTTRRFIAYGGELYGGDIHRHQLSLAALVMNAFTDRQADVPLRVFLKELRRVRPLRSQSGLFCFEDIPAGQYTLVVEPDPITADYFFLQPRPGEAWKPAFERPVRLPLPDPLSPLEVVTLAPSSSYPFPANATLARGRVTEGAAPVNSVGAIVSANYNQVDPQDNDKTVTVKIETMTDAAGEYALFFQKLPDKTQRITVTASKNGQQDRQPVEIKEGSTRNRPLHFP